MPFATDRDLLAFEPNLFRDIAWTGQRRISADDGATSGSALTSASSNFTSARIKPGHVAMLDAIPLEVISIDSDTQLTVSLLRDDVDDPTLSPPALTDAPLVITTFGPQIASVHDQLLRALGIEPTNPNAQPSAADITNPAALARLEVLGALHLIFTAAATLSTTDDILRTKAEMYRDRFIAQRNRLAVGVDLDGDGLPEATRRLNTIQFIRA